MLYIYLFLCVHAYTCTIKGQKTTYRSWLFLSTMQVSGNKLTRLLGLTVSSPSTCLAILLAQRLLFCTKNVMYIVYIDNVYINHTRGCMYVSMYIYMYMHIPGKPLQKTRSFSIPGYASVRHTSHPHSHCLSTGSSIFHSLTHPPTCPSIPLFFLLSIHVSIPLPFYLHILFQLFMCLFTCAFFSSYDSILLCLCLLFMQLTIGLI